MKRIPPVLLVLVGLGLATEARAQFIQDGGFESHVAGSPGSGAFQLYFSPTSFDGAWRVATDASVALFTNGNALYYPTPAGHQFVDFSDEVVPFSLEQDLTAPLEGGSLYQLSFLQAAFPSAPDPGRLHLELAPTTGGPAVFAQDFLLDAGSDWTSQVAAIAIPTTGSYTLRFGSFEDAASMIDEVSLVPAPLAPVPEPSALALAGLAASGLVVRRRRRQR